MIKNIDIEKSKLNNRVYFRHNFLSIGIRWFHLLFFTIAPPAFAFNNVGTLHGDPLGQFILIIGSLAFSGFVIYLAKNPNKNKLIRISADKLNINKLKKIINELGWFIEVNKTDYFIVIPNSWYYQITIIFDNEDFLISSVRLSTYDVYTFNDKKYLKKLLDRIG